MATLKRKNSDGTYSVVAQSGNTQNNASAAKPSSNSLTSSGGKVTLTSKNASVNSTASKSKTVSKKKSPASFNIRSLQPSASSTSVSKTSGGFSSKTKASNYQKTSSGRSRTETETFSPLKLVEGIAVKGADEFASGVTNTAAWLERNLLEPFFPGITESTPIQDLNKYYQGVKESNQNYYASNASAGGKLAETVDQYGTMTAAAVPNAVLALMTVGGSAAASAGTKGLQAISAAASKAPGIASAVQTSASAMSRNPNLWSSFFQITGNSYDSAIADGASEDAANLYALANGLLASGVEIGGGLEMLPRNLRNNGDAVLAWINGMLEEGGEEVVQGAIERGLQNLVYGKNNDLVSWNDPSAVFNPVAASEEFLGGALVGGILGGGQIAAARGIEALSNRAAAQAQQKNDVQEIANTLGENGQKAFSSFYDHNADPASYSDQFLRAYNAGLEGTAAPSSTVADQAVSTAAYFAGQNDAQARRTQLETDAEREAYYQAGLTGRALETVRVPESRLTESQRMEAYEKGRTSAETSLAEEIKSAGAAVNENAGLVSSARADRLSQADRDFLDSIAKKTGVSIEIAEPTGEGGANGWYQNGKIYISQDAENSLDVVVKHEITHRLQELSPESYRAYRNYAVNALTERQGSSVNLIQRYKDLYAEHNVTLTTEQAMDEIAADFTETILQDRASIEKLVRQDRTVAQRFLDAVKDFLRKVKDTLSGNRRAQDQAAAEAYGVTVDQLEEAARLWESLLTEDDTSRIDNRGNPSVNQVRFSLKSIDEQQENYDKINRRIQELSRKKSEIEESDEYKKFTEDVKNLSDEELPAVLEKYSAWEKSSGFSDISKELKELRLSSQEAFRNLERAKKESLEEARSEYRSKFNDEFSKKYASKAARKFGTTSRFDRAGYLTVNGSLLDFSDGQGYRVLDHRQIAEVLDFLPYYHEYSDGMIEFMNMGNIRMQSYGIDISKAPNSKQKSVLRKFFQSLDGEVTVDFSKENGNNDGSIDYSEGTRPDKILRDIDRYFETGEIPEQSDVAMFHNMYSIKGPDALRENARLQAERDSLEKETARLRERMEYWKGQTRRTKTPTIDKKAVQKTARELIEESGATVSRDEISADLQTLYDSIAKDPDGKIGDSYPNAWSMSDAVSRKIIESAVETDDEMYNAYADLRKFLKTTPIEISKSEAALIPDFNDWKRAQRGRMKVTAGESTNVNQVYQELSAMWPEFFDAERDVPPLDQLIRISDILNSLYTITEYNPYERGGYLDNAVSRLSNEIMERFMELPQTKPTFADRQAAKISALRAQNRERIAQAVAQERSRRVKEVQSLKDRYAVRDTARRERQTARSLRAKISRHASALSRKLLTPSDKANIPESLRGSVASALESINMESLYTVDPETGRRVKSQEGDPVKRTEAFLKLKEEYAKIAGSSDSDMIIDPALFGDAAEGFQGNFDKVISMRNIRLDEMNSDQLQTVWDVVRSLEHAVQTSGQILSKSKFTSTKAWAESIKRDTDTIRDRGGKTVRGLILDNETPYTFFSHYGNSGLSIYRMLRNAQDSQQIMTDQVAEQTAKIADEKTVKALNETTHEFTTERGDNLTLSTSQIMELAMLMQRPQAAQHLMSGGIIQPEIKGTKIRRGTEPIPLSFQDLMDITKTLSQSELKIAQDLQKLMVTTLADLGNKASMEAYGYEKFRDEKYWPIRSAREGLRTDVEKGGQNTRSIKNIGMAQSVVPNASNPIELSGVFDTFSRHTADMVDYAAWLVPMEDINRLYNYKFKDGDGNPTGETIKGLLDKKGGYGSQQYWHRLMEDIQNGIASVNDTTVAGAINRVIGNTKGAAVGANARVVIQQPTAFFRASSVLSPANLARGIKSGVTKGNGWKKALQYSAIAKRKNVGSFEISNPRQMNELLFGEKTNLAKLSDALSRPAAAADKITWGRLWNACEWTVKQQRPDLQAGSPEFYKAVDRVFTDLIDQTQVVDGVLQRSQIMRSNNAINKQATSFMGEPTMALNMIYRAWDQYRYETDPAKRSAARKNFGRAAVALAVTNIVNAFAQSLVDGMRDDDKDKKYWDRVMTAFTGMTGEEETPWDSAYATIITGNIGGNLNPVGMLPYARDALSLIQGYNVTRMDADVVGDLIRAAQTMQDSLTGDKKKTLLYATKELSNQVGKLFGISAGNILRDVSGLVRSIAIETGNVPLMYEMEKAVNNISSSSNKGRYMDLLFIALQQGDLDSYRQISSDLISSGVTDGAAIENIMRSKYKTAQGKDPSFTLPQESVNAIGFREKLYTAPASEKSFSEADLTASQYQSFSSERSTDYQSVSDQLESSGLYRALSDQGKEKAMGYAYDLSSERALEDASGGQYQSDTKWIQQADEANQAGIDDWEYVLWKAAYAMAETTRDENGDIVDGESKSDHVREWLNGFDSLTEDEKAYLWSTVYSSEWSRQIESRSSDSGLWWK